MTRPPTVKCPNCGHPVTIPADFAKAEESRFPCPNCGAYLRVHKKPASTRGVADATTGVHAKAAGIPGYEIHERLGKGGMASVFKGVQISTGRTIAIKVLPPSAARHPDLVRRFERESSMLAAIAHPNVVQIIDSGRSGNIYYFIMEYISGRPLRERMDEGDMSLKETIDIVARIGGAIQYCHELGLVHRDLKPGNVLITERGDVKVTDFGIAGILEHLGEITEQGVLLGTPQYVAPEQLKDGSNIDARADQYSLAVMTYEMLTHGLPVGVFQPVSSRRNDVPATVDEVLRRALARNPADRFPNVNEFVEHLCQAANYTPALTSTLRHAVAPPPHPSLPQGLPTLDKIPAGHDSDPVVALEGIPIPAAPPIPKSPSTSSSSSSASSASRPLTPVRTHWHPLARIALIAAIGGLMIGIAWNLIEQRRRTQAAKREMTFVGGFTAPGLLKSPIVEANDLENLLDTEKFSMILIATRTPSGQWVVDPGMFRCLNMDRIVSLLPIHLMDSSLESTLSSGWKWHEGLGMVLMTHASGDTPRMLMAVTSPLHRQMVCRALADSYQAAEMAWQQLSPRPLEQFPNLLTNGDFAQPVVPGVNPNGWNLITDDSNAPSTDKSSGLTPQTDPNLLSSTRYISLGLDNNIRGIQQTFRVMVGGEHDYSFWARCRGAKPSWLTVHLEVLSSPILKTTEASTEKTAGTSISPTDYFRTAWSMGIEVGKTWRRYEIRWLCDEATPVPQGRLALSTDQGLLDVADVRIQVIPLTP